MINSNDAIKYLKEKIIQLIDNGTLKGNYKQSNSTISFYVNDIMTVNRPLITLTLRLSDHHPKMKNYVNNDISVPSTEPNTNLSIEFYKPLYKSNGKRAKNQFDDKVTTKDITVLPFEITYFDYPSDELEFDDLDTIYQNILNWINGLSESYIDPFANTEKEASTETKKTNIKTSFNTYASQRDSVNFIRNQKDGWKNASQAEINWWKSKLIGDSKVHKSHVINESFTIKLTENDLHNIIKESVLKILSQQK